MIRGAEATIVFEDGKVLKKREPKKYRNEKLDQRLREERTESEHRLTQEALKYGANAPETEKLDETSLEIQKIEGEPLKHLIEDRPELLEDMGSYVGFIHSADIIHGDLTTSNALVEDESGELYLIDFGLAYRSDRLEDKAVDIHLLKQVLESSHPETAEKVWENFVEGYSEYEASEKVLDQLEDVEERGRYK